MAEMQRPTADELRALEEEIGNELVKRRLENILDQPNGLDNARYYLLGCLHHYMRVNDITVETILGYYRVLGFSPEDASSFLEKDS